VTVEVKDPSAFETDAGHILSDGWDLVLEWGDVKELGHRIIARTWICRGSGRSRTSVDQTQKPNQRSRAARPAEIGGLWYRRVADVHRWDCAQVRRSQRVSEHDPDWNEASSRIHPSSRAGKSKGTKSSCLSWTQTMWPGDTSTYVEKNQQGIFCLNRDRLRVPMQDGRQSGGLCTLAWDLRFASNVGRTTRPISAQELRTLSLRKAKALSPDLELRIQHGSCRSAAL